MWPGAPGYSVSTAPGEFMGVGHSSDFTRLPGDWEGLDDAPCDPGFRPGLAACSGVGPRFLLTLGASSATIPAIVSTPSQILLTPGLALKTEVQWRPILF